MFYNIDDLYGMERKAADTYVDGSSLGGSTTYNPTITKLCADWRELQAQVAQLQTEVAARDFINRNSLQLGAEPNAQIAALTADLDRVSKYTVALEGECKALRAERDAARKALAGVCHKLASFGGSWTMTHEEQIEHDRAIGRMHPEYDAALQAARKE